MAIAHLADSVDRQGDHFLRAANGLVKTIRMDWYRPAVLCGERGGHDARAPRWSSGTITAAASQSPAAAMVAAVELQR